MQPATELAQLSVHRQGNEQVAVAANRSGGPLEVELLADHLESRGLRQAAAELLLASRQPAQMWGWIAALSAAIAVCALVLLLSDRLYRWLGHSVVNAVEKLMGLVLTAIAVEMILAGLKRYFDAGP